MLSSTGASVLWIYLAWNGNSAVPGGQLYCDNITIYFTFAIMTLPFVVVLMAVVCGIFIVIVRGLYCHDV